MTAADRAARSEAADRLCAAAYDEAQGPATGVALVAVGGYGRGELAPCSDLDVVLVHDDDVDDSVLAPVLERLWYPLWDSGSRVDHAVRSAAEMTDTAAEDLKVMLGHLDLRHLAGARTSRCGCARSSSAVAPRRPSAPARAARPRPLPPPRHR